MQKEHFYSENRSDLTLEINGATFRLHSGLNELSSWFRDLKTCENGTEVVKEAKLSLPHSMKDLDAFFIIVYSHWRHEIWHAQPEDLAKMLRLSSYFGFTSLDKVLESQFLRGVKSDIRNEIEGEKKKPAVFSNKAFWCLIKELPRPWNISWSGLLCVRGAQLMEHDKADKTSEDDEIKYLEPLKLFPEMHQSAVKVFFVITDGDCAMCSNLLKQPCLTTCETSYNPLSHCPWILGNCGHMYHEHCITSWMKRYTTCPCSSCNWTIADSMKI